MQRQGLQHELEYLNQGNRQAASTHGSGSNTPDLSRAKSFMWPLHYRMIPPALAHTKTFHLHADFFGAEPVCSIDYAHVED